MVTIVFITMNSQNRFLRSFNFYFDRFNTYGDNNTLANISF